MKICNRYWGILFLLAQFANAAPSKVGNGDEGSDLEGCEPIESGKIVEARQQALELLKKLNVGGVAGLGMLGPELETSKLYRARKDGPVELSEDGGAFHADMRGLVFARTFAHPHSATRFFPVAEALSESQLVALHIHEALHRALSPAVNENESVVSTLTLAITSPDATHDEVKGKAARVIPQIGAVTAGSETSVAASVDPYPIPDDAAIRQPSQLGYEYFVFRSLEKTSYPVNQMHVLKSYLYPFGSDNIPLGLGIEMSLIQRDTGASMGQLNLSARMRLWSGRGFDVGVFGGASLNTLSAEELKNSPLGRDLATIGLSIGKNFKHAYIENFLSYSTPGSSHQKVGSIDYTHSYGSVVNVTLKAGAKWWKVHGGGFCELFLADYYRVEGGAFSYDSGRYRIIAIGPEVKYVGDNFGAGVRGRLLANSTQSANFDFLGNLMGQGVAQGSLSGFASIYF